MIDFNDDDGVEHIEITAVPEGSFECIHVEPLAHERHAVVQLNKCLRCKSIGASNYPSNNRLLDDFTCADECDFCGCSVMMNVAEGKWEIEYRLVTSKPSWFKPSIKRAIPIGGKWKVLSKKY